MESNSKQRKMVAQQLICENYKNIQYRIRFQGIRGISMWITVCKTKQAMTFQQNKSVFQILCCKMCKSHLPGGRPMGGGLSMLPPCSMVMWCPWCAPGNWPSATAIDAAAAAIAAGCCCCARSMAAFAFAWFIIATAESIQMTHVDPKFFYLK